MPQRDGEPHPALARLCFGTSTFVAGRLDPAKRSRPGIEALVAAISAGVGSIHSNPNLRTQWAIREALDEAGRPAGIRHLVKVEAPLDSRRDAMTAIVRASLETSAERLGTPRLHAAVVEIDLKRTAAVGFLVDPARVTAFYDDMADAARATGLVDVVHGYCHSPAHLLACLRARTVDGCAAQFNRVEAWPAGYFHDAGIGQRPFLAMAPLRRGALVRRHADGPADRLHALRWVIGQPAVQSVVTTMSSVEHVRDVVAIFLAAGRVPPGPASVVRT